eukprot:6933545-Lingulodinium_polyedra.AAC.1
MLPTSVCQQRPEEELEDCIAVVAVGHKLLEGSDLFIEEHAARPGAIVGIQHNAVEEDMAPQATLHHSSLGVVPHPMADVAQDHQPSVHVVHEEPESIEGTTPLVD